MKEDKNSLVNQEEEILKFWQKNKIFARSLKLAKKAKRFVFFEGPPSANAKAGIHHVLSRVYKDLFLRFKSMSGFLVERKAGWDTHGLPVEVQLEKELGLKNKKEIEQYGVDKFNLKARNLVWRYKQDWEKLTGRVGFWLDQKHPYITYDWRYMESLWWIIKQIANQKLLYQHYKVVPYCPRCGTPLSSHEVALGYESIKETSVYVKFRIKNLKAKFSLEETAYFLAWTTTPWTLPSNVALAVGPGIEYALAEKGGELLILAKKLAEVLGEDYKILKTFKGKELAGSSYEPLYDFIEPEPKKKVHVVETADFVSLKEGTGIVHLAAYGEEDVELAKARNIALILTVNEEGKFKQEVKPWAGMFVKDADPHIISDLKRRNLLFKVEDYTHDYPFCWRCHTPLIYYPMWSWFVAMSKLKNQLVKNNRKINWVPSYIKEGRFGQWLKELKDWSFSRNRYWGLPLPIWACQNCSHQTVIGSLEDLNEHRKDEPNTYILARHGETEMNRKQVLNSDVTIQGDDYGLNENGLHQVKKLISQLKKKNIDLIFASDFQRTKETAELVAREFNLEVSYDKRLRELDVGVFDGQPYSKIFQFFPNPLERFERGIPGGESFHKVRKRMMAFFQELEKKYQGKTILVVSHKRPIWMLEAGLWGLTDEEALNWQANNYMMTGTFRELKSFNHPYNRQGEIDLHRPYIDGIVLKCPKCKGESRRVPEVVDVWFDSGAMPFAQWHWPFENKDKIGRSKGEAFPADFITEGIDQTRGWFYSLLAVSALLKKGPPYLNVISLAHVLDKDGQKMSKSKGNTVDPWEVIDEYGADALRWYFYTVNQAGEPKLFDKSQVALQLRGFLRVFWNSWMFFETYAKKIPKKTSSIFKKSVSFNVLDEWLSSSLNETIFNVSNALAEYDATTAARILEKFVNDLSNWYIRRCRERFQHPSSLDDYESARRHLAEAMFKTAVLAAPFVPFISERIFQQLRRIPQSDWRLKESVHLTPYPLWQKGKTNTKLIESMELVRNLAALIHALRDKAKLKVRQPLKEVQIQFLNKVDLGEEFLQVLKEEVNVKEINLVDELKTGNDFVITETPLVKVGLNTFLDVFLKQEGFIRELIRNIQEMRKVLGLKADDDIELEISANEEFLSFLRNYVEEIKNKTQAKLVKLQEVLEGTFGIERDFNLGQYQIRVALKKL